jgi:hypothetical protein
MESASRAVRFACRHVRIVLQHLGRDMSGNCHDRAVAGLRFGKLGDGMVSQIVEAKSRERALHLLDVCSTLLIGASLSRVLISSAGRAGNQPCQVPPWGINQEEATERYGLAGRTTSASSGVSGTFRSWILRG